MPIKVLLDDSPLANANSIRGVGTYTKFLAQFLTKNPGIELSFMKDKDLIFKAEITHYPFFDLFFPTLPLIKRNKTVVTVHDVIPLLYPKYYPVGKKGTLALVKQKLALHNVDAVITDSNNSKTDIAKYLKFPLEKIHVIYLAANPNLNKATDQTIIKVARKYQLPKKYLLYVGDINYNKNISQLIKTLKFLPKVIHLVCVGKNFYPHDIPEWQWIASQIALSDVTNRVKFLTDLDSQETDDLAAIYSGAIAYIQPSLYEGFGLPILEAMVCQTPVVCANNSSLPEVALNKALIVEEPKAENFAVSVETILDWTQNEREKFLKQAVAHAKKFTWQKTAEETANLYQEVLKK
jgi:glycosyltransferase involved in cell wall biosynthesis